MFVVIQTGTIAAVAVAFAKFTGVFFPSVSASNYLIGSGKVGLTTQQLLAILVIVILTLVNTRGIRTGALVQNIFTFAKVASLLGLAVLGFLLGRNPHAISVNFGNFWSGASFSWSAVALVGTAMVGPLFASDSWNNVTFAADAMSDIDAASHEHTLKKIFPRLGEIDSTDAILALLA